MADQAIPRLQREDAVRVSIRYVTIRGDAVRIDECSCDFPTAQGSHIARFSLCKSILGRCSDVLQDDGGARLTREAGHVPDCEAVAQNQNEERILRSDTSAAPRTNHQRGGRQDGYREDRGDSEDPGPPIGQREARFPWDGRLLLAINLWIFGDLGDVACSPFEDEKVRVGRGEE